MRNLVLIRRYELIFVVSIAVLYVVRRLFQSTWRLDDMVEMALYNRAGRPTWVILKALDSYNHFLNHNFPIIAGVFLCLVAWYVFHYIAFPKITELDPDPSSWLYVGLCLTLLLSSAGIYHYFIRYIDYKYGSYGEIIGLKMTSSYSKRNVVADAIGLGLFIFSYELLAQAFYYLRAKFETGLVGVIAYVPFLFPGILALVFAVAGPVHTSIWQPPFGDLLLFSSLAIQIYILQHFFRKAVLPHLSGPQNLFLIGRLGLYLALCLLGNLLVWGAFTHFSYRQNHLIFLFILITLFLPGIIAYLRARSSSEKKVLETRISSKSAELDSLRSQINPHFLFNALNSLYATALKEGSEQTADGIQKLGDMMRFMLQENNRDRIPLTKEIEYLQNYIQIQRMRLDESHGIEIRVNLQEPDASISIAPMMLTPFVENAFKHGISLRKPSWIFITLTMDRQTIYFKVHNSQHAKLANDPEVAQSGVGLENVRKRLELIYPNRHTLAIQQSEQDYFIALTLTY
ncbi:sensor histidine kinase [Tellurirhabdus bombi]|uniref:sensor histidine kinase n=1 Tax=Tellurirhabdus bombi TaxID=2907205 RepID=UPI001F1E6BCF|nr:histidine kinase [Tellurirhabdus bombi]